MLPIGFCSIVAGTLSVIEWLRLKQISKDYSKSLSEIVQSVRKCSWKEALQITTKHPHPILSIWRAAFSLLSEGESDLRDIEETVSIEGAKLIAQLEATLKTLGALITILPMLGFLGTILGLIASFQNWEQMGAQVSIGQLAGGIYQAMITTAAGLITAIPYYLLYYYFSVRVEKVAIELSKKTTELFRWIKEALLRQTPLETESILSPMR